MTNATGAFEIVACALRPEGSFAHLAVLVAFVVAAWWLAPSPRRSGARR
jgi:hypothetical protein